MSLGIEVENLTLRYGAFTALRDISFSLTGGKIYGLLGRNGSGKTTLLSVLAAFRRATEGTVLVGGEPVFENGAITNQICLIRDSVDTVDKGARVRDALAFAGTMRPSWDADYAAALLDRFEVDPRKRVAELSRGKRSALGIVLGLASRAPLTMLDEPHIGLDAPSRHLFYDELLADFIENPRTVILSTHLIEEVGSLLEEVVLIDRGRMLLHQETDELRSHGTSITGAAEAVDRFTADHTLLSEKRLGPTKSAMVYGKLTDDRMAQARAAGLDLGPVALQELFVHLTQPAGGNE